MRTNSDWRTGSPVDEVAATRRSTPKTGKRVMVKTLVLTFIAQDRPGLVEKLSEAVTEEGGNWLERRMAHLAGEFAGIARIEIPGDKVSSLKNALIALEAEGFRLTVQDAIVGAPLSDTALSLDLVGPDHPGIVREISR